MHPKLLKSRYRLFTYRHREREIAAEHTRILDIGCGDGENLLRFDSLAPNLARHGIEVSFPRLKIAQAHRLNVAQASGVMLPYAADSFDMIYVAHVLHHVDDYMQLLREIGRVLAPGGTLFVVETVTDHPILRLARRWNPYWQGDHVEHDWTYQELMAIFEGNRFEVVESGRYNLIFWLWEMFPLTFWPFEIFTPLFIELDLIVARFLHKYSVHTYAVLRESADNGQ